MECKINIAFMKKIKEATKKYISKILSDFDDLKRSQEFVRQMDDLMHDYEEVYDNTWYDQYDYSWADKNIFDFSKYSSLPKKNTYEQYDWLDDAWDKKQTLDQNWNLKPIWIYQPQYTYSVTPTVPYYNSATTSASSVENYNVSTSCYPVNFTYNI